MIAVVNLRRTYAINLGHPQGRSAHHLQALVQAALALTARQLTPEDSFHAPPAPPSPTQKTSPE